MEHEPGRLVDGDFRRHPRGGASTSHPTHKPQCTGGGIGTTPVKCARKLNDEEVDLNSNNRPVRLKISYIQLGVASANFEFAHGALLVCFQYPLISTLFSIPL